MKKYVFRSFLSAPTAKKSSDCGRNQITVTKGPSFVEGKFCDLSTLKCDCGSTQQVAVRHLGGQILRHVKTDVLQHATYTRMVVETPHVANKELHGCLLEERSIATLYCAG